MPVATYKSEDIEENLYPGAKFSGEQKSKTSKYSGKNNTFMIAIQPILVEVQVDYVDWDQSYICGCLNILGLTEQDPSITTFFTGEIIGTTFPFLTRKWDATYETDESHWR